MVNLGKHHPELYRAVAALSEQADAALLAADLDPLVGELVKLRVSQLNGCAFCLRMHTRDALARGESTDRLAVVAAWWESQYFTEVERAALSLAEEVTELAGPRHPVEGGVLSDAQVSAVTWVAVVMNSWNRIAVRSHYPVAP